MTELLSFSDLVLTNGILIWVGLRIVKRVDALDTTVNDHETRLQLNEQQLKRGAYA